MVGNIHVSDLEEKMLGGKIRSSHFTDRVPALTSSLFFCVTWQLCLCAAEVLLSEHRK